MQKFELVLRNEKTRSYKVLFLLFILLNLGFLLAMAFYSGTKAVWGTTGLCLVMTAVGFGTEYYYKRRNKFYSGKGAAAVFIILAFITLKLWWAALAMLLIAFLYAVSVRRLIVYVNPKEIIFPSFPKRHLAWIDLNNMILKDGILTIDFKNNKLSQSEVINGENDYDVNEKEFNEFCKLQLTTVHS